MSAGDYYQSNVLPAEVAGELLNSVRAIVLARVYEIEKSDPGTADQLAGKASSLKRLQDGIDVRSADRSLAIIAKWGPLLKNEPALWAELAEVEAQAA